MSFKSQAVLVVLILAVAVTGVPQGAVRNAFLERAQKLLDQNMLVDGHNDWPYMLRINFDNQLVRVNLTSITKEEYNLVANKGATHTDIKRLREGRVGAQFWAVIILFCNTVLNYIQLIRL